MITFRSQSLQDNEDSRLARWYFDVIEGLPGHEPPEVRGEDPIAPGRQGHYVGNRVNDRLPILVEGFIRGFGADAAERSADWHTNTLLILGVFQLDDAPGALEVGPGSNNYLGLEADWAIEARTTEVLAGPIGNHMSYQTWSMQLEAVWSDGEWWLEGS